LTISTVADLIEALKAMPQDLRPFITNGDLDNTPVTSVSVEAADFGQLVLISR